MKPLPFFLKPAIVIIVALAFTGCKTVPPWAIPTAVLSIPVGAKTAKVPVTVGRVLPNEHSVAGIKWIKAGRLDDALRELEIGVPATVSFVPMATSAGQAMRPISSALSV